MKNAIPRIIVPFLLFTTTTPFDATLAQEGATMNPLSLALRYAETLAAGSIDDWARLDLGCLSRLRGAPTIPSETRPHVSAVTGLASSRQLAGESIQNSVNEGGAP